MTEPLIYTIKGNLPIASLEYSTRWEDNEAYAKFTETYKLGGEVVRESAHVYDKKGVAVQVTAGNF